MPKEGDNWQRQRFTTLLLQIFSVLIVGAIAFFIAKHYQQDAVRPSFKVPTKALAIQEKRVSSSEAYEQFKVLPGASKVIDFPEIQPLASLNSLTPLQLQIISLTVSNTPHGSELHAWLERFYWQYYVELSQVFKNNKLGQITTAYSLLKQKNSQTLLYRLNALDNIFLVLSYDEGNKNLQKILLVFNSTNAHGLTREDALRKFKQLAVIIVKIATLGISNDLAQKIVESYFNKQAHFTNPLSKTYTYNLQYFAQGQISIFSIYKN